MRYRTIPVTPFAQNCTLLICPDTQDIAIVDPGGDVERIVAAVTEEGGRVTQIWLTHGHVDHIGGVAALRDHYEVPVIGPHRADASLIAHVGDMAHMFGVPVPPSFTPTRWLEEGDRLSLGQCDIDVMHCPGHAPGHVVFINRQARIAQVGDVLFNNSIGRTDLPGGDHATLLASIARLWALGDDMVILPGHGPQSTLGQERRHNPFVQQR